MIKIGDATGIVLQRKLVTTRLKTFKNKEITIPSLAILAGHVTNYSQEAKTGGVILYTTVTIGYDAPWETVHELLIEAAKATHHILKTPPPFVLQTALNDFYVSYQLNAYTDSPQFMPGIYPNSTRISRTSSTKGGWKSCRLTMPNSATATEPRSLRDISRRTTFRHPSALWIRVPWHDPLLRQRKPKGKEKMSQRDSPEQPPNLRGRRHPNLGSRWQPGNAGNPPSSLLQGVQIA